MRLNSEMGKKSDWDKVNGECLFGSGSESGWGGGEDGRKRRGDGEGCSQPRAPMAPPRTAASRPADTRLPSTWPASFPPTMSPAAPHDFCITRLVSRALVGGEEEDLGAVDGLGLLGEPLEPRERLLEALPAAVPCLHHLARGLLEHFALPLLRLQAWSSRLEEQERRKGRMTWKASLQVARASLAISLFQPR